MDGVSSALAVVSLAIQLVETGEKISKFLSSVQDAPNEVTKLAQTLDQLNSTLKQVSSLLEQQYLVLRLPGSPVFIANALKNCEKRIQTLENVIQKAKSSLDHGNRVQRSWAAMRFVSKKKDIQEWQCQLRDAEAGLQTAILSNSWQLQMHHIHISSSRSLQATKITEPSLKVPIKYVSQHEGVQNVSSTSKDIFRSTAEETYLVWYRGFFGSIRIQTKSTSRRLSNTRKSNEKIITIMPVFLRKVLELRLSNSCGRIMRTLSTYNILASGAPIFETCLSGDLQSLQVALSSGNVSPFVVDELGSTLLHYAAYYSHAEVCALLLQLGVDSNHMDLAGRKAMNLAVRPLPLTVDSIPRENEVDTLRLLTKSQVDISESDLSKFWAAYDGPVEMAEYMISQTLIQMEHDISNGENTFPPLAAVLALYGADQSQWESFLRLLLRKGAGLHSPVRRRWGVKELNDYLSPQYPCSILEHGTPLDALFSKTRMPFEGKAAAEQWLALLSSEGYDVKAYIEEEQALHAAQMQLTYPYTFLQAYDNPRQLVYHGGSSPSVSWDWWIDPNSSTYLVREEFKHMDLLGRDYASPWNEWETLWPLTYPAWSDHFSWYEVYLTFSHREPLYEFAQKRANRRMKKKSMKAARAQGFKKRDKMPGAWPL